MIPKIFKDTYKTNTDFTFIFQLHICGKTNDQDNNQ